MAEIFRPEKFRKVLTMYLIMWGILWAAAVLVVSFAPPHRVFGKVILYGTTSIGYFANGLFSLGIVTISPIVSVGVIAIGPGACGVYCTRRWWCLWGLRCRRARGRRFCYRDKRHRYLHTVAFGERQRQLRFLAETPRCEGGKTLYALVSAV